MSAQDNIMLGHGSGGIMMKELIDQVFLDAYTDKELYLGDDATVLSNLQIQKNQRIVMSTDSYVVHPQFFPGGDIGRLAVCGTVNDVATSGAKPVALSIGFILEEGYAVSDLKNICSSIAQASLEAGVKIVTGDTKVVEHGKADGVFINTSGVGVVDMDCCLSGNNCNDGDIVLLSGSVGDHGITIMSCREGLNFDADIKSDAAPLNKMIEDVLSAAPNTKCFRDPTRGGLASSLNEIALQSSVDICIDEAEVPVKKSVKNACEMLGYDPFQVANEGKMLAIVPKNEADAALCAMKNSKYGSDAAIIGQIEKMNSDKPKVYVLTEYKTKRILDMLVGQQLPRIC